MVNTIVQHSNIIIDNGGSNQTTVYNTSVEEVRTKMISVKQIPSTGTVKNNKILDLLKVETRFEIRGFIVAADKSKLRSLLNNRGVTSMVNYDSEAFNVNFDKISIAKPSTPVMDVVTGGGDYTETEYLEVTITCFVGEDL